MTAPDYGRAFALWRAASPAWEAYVRHDFVEGLKRGDQPRAGFLNYLKQDYLFLLHFARAWSLAVAKAGDLEEMRAASDMTQAILSETALHVGFCEAEGISRDEILSAEEALQNLAYTRYVLEAGYSGDFLDLLAALAPCVLGYGEIGARLKAEAGETPYRAWIEAYGGEEYQRTCREAGALLDRALTRRLGPQPEASPRWPELTRRFATAVRLEAAFWDLGA